MTLDTIKPYAKAVAGFLVPFAGAIVTAVQLTSPGGEGITAAEWISAIALAITTGGAVYTIPNRDPKAQHQRESVQPPHVGDEMVAIDIPADGRQYDVDFETGKVTPVEPLDAPNEDYQR